jgi:hypothetical protein
LTLETISKKIKKKREFKRIAKNKKENLKHCKEYNNVKKM